MAVDWTAMGLGLLIGSIIILIGAHGENKGWWH